MQKTLTYDVAVVGGGAAGLSGAIALARSLRSVALFDGGEPRNAPADEAHNVLGREGISPAELLAAGRREAEQYGVQLIPATVRTAVRDGGLFRLETDTGTRIWARKLLLATGLVDELPEVEGLRELWGRSVLHCPYCHGWEVRGQRIGVLGTEARSVHQALMFRQLSDRISFFTHTGPPLAGDQIEQLEALQIKIIHGEVERLRSKDRALSSVLLAGGQDVAVDALAVAPRFVAHGDLYTQLGGTLTVLPGAGSKINTDPVGRTDLPGVYAAGNASDLSAMVSMSSGAGIATAAVINYDLITEQAQAAVAERRDPFSADREAANSRQLLGDRRHGWDPVTVPE
ncbi:MAG TPA: NAD(P)/FAD-dependent oxidoreductase [Microlunatus sp.]